MANIREMHDTLNILQAQRDFDWSGIYMRWVNQFPLETLLMKLGTENATNPRFDHFEDELLTDTVNASTAYGTSTTSLVLTDASSCVAGEVLHNPVTTENMRITSVTVSTNTVVVERGYGGTTAQNIASGQELRNIGPTYEEGGTLADPVSTKVEQKYNYCQIFKKTISLSKTLAASTLYGGPDEAHQIMAGEKVFMRNKNYAFQFGSRSESTLNGRPIRQTGGLLEWLTYNVKDNGGSSLTETIFDTWLQDVFTYGDSNTRFLLASPLLVKIITSFSKGKLQTFQGTQTYGIKITQYVSPFGDLNIVMDRLLKGNTYGAWGWLLDFNNLKYKVLRSMQMRRNVQNPGDDAIKHELLCEAGLKVTDPRSMGILKNFTV